MSCLMLFGGSDSTPISNNYIIECGIYTSGENKNKPIATVTNVDVTKEFVHHGTDDAFLYDNKYCNRPDGYEVDIINTQNPFLTGFYLTDYLGNSSSEDAYMWATDIYNKVYRINFPTGQIAEAPLNGVTLYGHLIPFVSHYQYAFCSDGLSTYSLQSTYTTIDNMPKRVSYYVYNNLNDSGYIKQQTFALGYDPNEVTSVFTLYNNNSAIPFTLKHQLVIKDAIGTLGRTTEDGPLTGSILCSATLSGSPMVYRITEQDNISPIKALTDISKVKILTPEFYWDKEDGGIYDARSNTTEPVITNIAAADYYYCVDKEGKAYRLFNNTPAYATEIGATTNGKYIGVHGNFFLKNLYK